MKIEIEITESEIKDLKRIRNYFGEHDKTQLEHLAYSELDKLVKKLSKGDVSRSACVHKWKVVEPQYNGTLFICEKCGAED